MGAYSPFYSVGLGQGAECKHKIYTLRYNYYEARMFEGVVISVDHKSHHCQNLSIDYDTAVEKAKKLQGEVRVGDPMTLNDFSPRSANYIWDGELLCFGNKYFGHKISEMVEDKDALNYLVGYSTYDGSYSGCPFGYPSSPRKADRDCLDYINSLQEVQDRKAEIEKDRKESKVKVNKALRAVEAIAEKCDYIGSEGVKLMIEDALVIGLFTVDSGFGTSWCVQMKSGDDYLVTFTNSKKFITQKYRLNQPPDRNYDLRPLHPMEWNHEPEFEVGDKISFKATVKRHTTRSMKLDENGLPSFPDYVAEVDVKQTQIKMPVLTAIKDG